MQVYVNDKPVDIVPGTKVKHALINSGLLDEVKKGGKVCDEWGNEMGLDGALTEGMKIYVK
jgi:hypothetical protein